MYIDFKIGNQELEQFAIMQLTRQQFMLIKNILFESTNEQFKDKIPEFHIILKQFHESQAEIDHYESLLQLNEI